MGKITDCAFGLLNDAIEALKNAKANAIERLKLWKTAGSQKSFELSEGEFAVLDKNGDVEICVKNVEYISPFTYTKKQEDDYEKDRKEFNDTKRAEFLIRLSEDRETLTKNGFTDEQISQISEGIVPDGFEVHHKKSLENGGDNDYNNLILIDNKSHDIFTRYQNTFTKTRKFKDSKNKQGQSEVEVVWVMPTGSVCNQNSPVT